MTTSDGGHLHLVPGATPAPGDPSATTAVRTARVGALAATTAALSVVLVALGGQPWSLPGRDGGGVDAVPPSLVHLVLLCAAACVWSAGRVVQPAATFRSPAAARVWWLVLAGAALVSGASALSLASYAGSAQRPGQLLVSCAVPLLPAVLAGVLARDDGRPARIRAALGTGVVTLPMTALGWALLASPSAAPAGAVDVLGMTLLAGLAPLSLGVAFVAADRRNRLLG